MDETETTKRKLDENSNVEEESGCNGSQPKVSSQELPSTYQVTFSNLNQVLEHIVTSHTKIKPNQKSC